MSKSSTDLGTGTKQHHVTMISIAGVIGTGLFVGILPNSIASSISNLFAHQDFMPNGVGAVLAAMLTTMLSFLVTDIVMISA